jgi:hypothetical protein
MRKILSSLIPAALLVGAASPALAGGSEGSIGVGVEYNFAVVNDLPFGGVSANYDMGQFHVGGALGFADGGGDAEDNTYYSIGGRFYYHLHSTAMSDFGVGGEVHIASAGDGDPDTDNDTYMIFEPGVQIRAFVASNVALSLSAGIAIGLMDAEGFALSGQATGGAGVHYYFF